MKKKPVIMIGMIAAVFLIYFVGPGFMKNAAVYIEDYTVNADGSEITIWHPPWDISEKLPFPNRREGICTWTFMVHLAV